MTLLICTLFIACLLPFIAKVPVAIAMNKADGYNNKYPREQQAKLDGFGARALAAHQNAFESLIIFAPAILVALVTNNTGSTVQALAIAHIIARVLYNVFYLLNIHLLRSLIWSIGLGSSLAIIYLSMAL